MEPVWSVYMTGGIAVIFIHNTQQDHWIMLGFNSMCYSTVKAEDMGYPNTKSNHNDTISKEGGMPGAYASVSNHEAYGDRSGS